MEQSANMRLPLPPSLRQVPNIPLRKLSLEELIEEHAYWQREIESATEWGAALAFADERRRACNFYIKKASQHAPSS